jgi:hypothetical protein
VQRYRAESQLLIDNPELNDEWSHAYSDPKNPPVKLYDLMIQTTAYKIVNDEKVKPAQKKQLFEASQTPPDVFAALNTKIDQLREGQARLEEDYETSQTRSGSNYRNPAVSDG